MTRDKASGLEVSLLSCWNRRNGSRALGSMGSAWQTELSIPGREVGIKMLEEVSLETDFDPVGK